MTFNDQEKWEASELNFIAKGLSTYINVIFQFVLLDKFAKKNLILLSLCYYVVLSID